MFAPTRSALSVLFLALLAPSYSECSESQYERSGARANGLTISGNAPANHKERRSPLEIRRHELKGFSSEELLMAMMAALHEDDAVSAEAALLEGLNPNMTYHGPGLYDPRFPLLQWAAKLHAPKCTKVLLDYGADIEGMGVHGDTPLIMAAISNAPSVIKILLRRGANVNAKDSGNNTSLHHAAEHGYVKIAEVLIKHGSNIEAKERGGKTPLMLAASSKHVDMCKLLLKKGADVNTSSKISETPLISAAKGCCAECIKVLLKFHPDIDAADIYGSTALHRMADCGNLDGVQILLESGASTTIEDKSGDTPCGTVCENTKCQYSHCIALLKLLCPHATTATVYGWPCPRDREV